MTAAPRTRSALRRARIAQVLLASSIALAGVVTVLVVGELVRLGVLLWGLLAELLPLVPLRHLVLIGAVALLAAHLLVLHRFAAAANRPAGRPRPSRP